jgi:hypothetical protein
MGTNLPFGKPRSDENRGLKHAAHGRAISYTIKISSFVFEAKLITNSYLHKKMWKIQNESIQEVEANPRFLSSNKGKTLHSALHLQ